MSMSDNTRAALDVTAKVLGRCFIIGTCVLIFWLVFLLAAGSWAFGIHSSYFQITRQHFDIIMYMAMAFFKLGIFALFGIPWIAIRLVLKKG